jgi:phosphate transport system substrate-binding protein
MIKIHDSNIVFKNSKKQPDKIKEETMKKIVYGVLSISAMLIFVDSICFSRSVFAQETLSYSCSNQIYQALEKENVEAFSKATGIDVSVYPASSKSCVNRLVHGYSDIASTATEMYHRHTDYNYKQIPICKDPLAVVAKKTCEVENISEEDLRGIFSGEITNWKEIGGADLPVLVIVPDENTAANKNFRKQIMKDKEIKHDFITYDSTMVLEAIKYFPCGAISFISRGATIKYEEIAAINIDGRSPSDKDYPYFQTFYYVIKNDPSEAAKKLIDFTTTGKGRDIILKNGMIPIGH